MGALHCASEKAKKHNQLILLPSSVSPNSPSVGPRRGTQKHAGFSLRSEHVACRAAASQARNPLFAPPRKHPLERPKKKKAQSVPECVYERGYV